MEPGQGGSRWQAMTQEEEEDVVQAQARSFLSAQHGRSMLALQSSMDQPFLLHVLLLAFEQGMQDAASQAAGRLMQRLQQDGGISRACVEVLCSLASPPPWLAYPLVPHAVRWLLSQQPAAAAISSPDSGSRGWAYSRAQALLLAVFRDLELVWCEASPDRRALLRELPPDMLRLLLSSSSLEVVTEDTVLFTIERSRHVQAAVAGNSSEDRQQLQALAQAVRLRQLSPEALCFLPRLASMRAGVGPAEITKALYFRMQQSRDIEVVAADGSSSSSSWAPRRPSHIDAISLSFGVPLADLLGTAQAALLAGASRSCPAASRGVFAGRCWEGEFNVHRLRGGGGFGLSFSLQPVLPSVGAVVWCPFGISARAQGGPVCQATAHLCREDAEVFALFPAVRFSSLAQLEAAIAGAVDDQQLTVFVRVPASYGSGALAVACDRSFAEVMFAY